MPQGRRGATCQRPGSIANVFDVVLAEDNCARPRKGEVARRVDLTEGSVIRKDRLLDSED